jgi:hypothetical protein
VTKIAVFVGSPVTEELQPDPTVNPTEELHTSELHQKKDTPLQPTKKPLTLQDLGFPPSDDEDMIGADMEGIDIDNLDASTGTEEKDEDEDQMDI